MRFIGTDRHTHASPERSALLLINLGTPQAPTAAAVRRYLREFLWDPRVVELPRWLWWPILNGPVLGLRPRRSAAKYASIWTAQGSPLLVNSQKQASALSTELAVRGLDIDVVLAMRYGQPSIGAAFAQLRAKNATRVLLLPLYPQYSAATTASAIDGVNRVITRLRNVPQMRSVQHFCDDPGYIGALAASVTEHWKRNGRGECLLISFHGLPRRNLDLGDPYHCQCQKTARLLAQALGLDPSACRVCFQSRFGSARWLEPATADTLQQLARGGMRRVDVICPGFVADCLETLEEIAIEGRAQFLTAGGQELRYVACLNDSALFISALADLVERNTGGWPVDASEQQMLARNSELSAELAIAMGAPR